MSTSDQELLDTMEMLEDDEALLEAVETTEAIEQFATVGDAFYEARENQRDWQRQFIEQSGGQINPEEPGRFVFELQPLRREVNRRYGIDERNYRVNLRQEGNIIDQIAPAIRDAMQRSVEQVLDNDRIPDNHHLYFDMFSERLAAGTYRSNGMTVGQWRNDPNKVDEIFNNLQQTLNSNESFQMDDTFRMEITTVAPAIRNVRGRRYRRTKVTYKGIDDFLIKNKSVILIKNPQDNLCAARAIVASKATVDYPPSSSKRKNLTKVRKTVSDVHQRKAAEELQQQAQVPLDVAVGADKLKKFQEALPEYRLVCIYTGRGHEAVPFSPYQKGKKLIVIVHVDDHYHACSSLKGYRQTNHVCDYCLNGYDHEGHHRCPSVENTKFCVCCRRQECPGFLEAHPQGLKPSQKCGECGRYFHGPICFENHLKYNFACELKPHDCLCYNIRRCKSCKKLNRSKQEINNHQCGFACCPTCKDYVKLETHRCYIESAGEVREKRKQQALANKERKRRKKEAEEAAEADPEEDGEEPSDLAEELVREQEEADGVNPDSDNPKDREPAITIFFDIEARQETGRHEANLLIYQTEDGTETILRGDNCVETFIKDLKDMADKKNRRLVVIAHNLQAYDGYFIIRDMYRDGKQLTQIRNGAKIMELEHYDIKFIDSMNFFAMPLKAFPSTFGLKYYEEDDNGHLITDEEGNYVEAFYAKGHFPHLFNRRENEDYVGPLPPKADYLPQTMSIEGKKEFEEWYDDQVANNAIFDFQRDIVNYCSMDVTILREGCQDFQKRFQEQAGFNPFEHITIASACNRDMINRIEKKTIASEPAYGWNGQLGNQSNEAMEWLLWMDECKRQEAFDNFEEANWEWHDMKRTPRKQHPCYKTYIQHAGNGGEKKIQYVKGVVDGYCEKTKTVYEYQGCFYHGCENCYPNRTERHTRLDNRQMWEVREVTREKVAKLKSLGLNVVEMWGCEWQKFKQDHPDCAAFVKNLNLTERLNPRDAFFGGRTNAAKLYHACNDHERIEYYDFTSLYPWVNKYGWYPIQHPHVYLNPQNQDIDAYFGVAKCRVRAPRNLYHPVPPVWVNGKLLFPLCVKCAEVQLDQPLLECTCTCPHNDVEREFEGTWCTPELQEAKKQGYNIVQIIEVYHFPEDQRRKGLFAPYIDKWYKIKTEASGWPKECNTEEKKNAFIAEFKRVEGIELSAEELDKGKNDGLRQLAKLMLNSMWGKFGQRPNKTQVAHFTNPEDFHEFLESDKYNIQKIQMLPDKNDPTKVNEDMVDVFYTMKHEDMEINGKCNIFIAAFTTCHARRKLYSELEKAGEQALYYDTDSMILLIDQNNDTHYQPQTGNFLGELTDELYDKKTKQSHYIVEFASAGPKNYGYVLENGKKECKVKGFSLNVEGSQYLNYELLRNNVLDEIKRPQYHPITGQITRRQYPVKRSHKIVRDVKNFELKTVEEEKKYQLVFDKRVVDPDTFKTYPYGYGDIPQEMDAETELDVNTLLDL